MAVTFEPKRRLRLPSGDVPEPKVVHSRSWLPFAIFVWVAAVVIGHGMLYGWLPFPLSATKSTSTSEPALAASMITVTHLAPEVPAVKSRTMAPAPVIETPSVDPGSLPACDKVADPGSNPDENVEPLPVDLSRSPFGALLDTRTWTKPCRAAHPIRVHLCIAVKAGQLLGATATTDPSDDSTSRCIIRAASRVAMEPDAALRKVHLTVDLPPDHGR